MDETNLPLDDFDFMDIHLKIHAENAKQRDVISFTVTIYEMENDVEMEKRGLSTIIHIVWFEIYLTGSTSIIGSSK